MEDRYNYCWAHLQGRGVFGLADVVPALLFLRCLLSVASAETYQGLALAGRSGARGRHTVNSGDDGGG
jgi:hypothetical protein